MKNIQVIDSASNATFSVFQATEMEFSVIFPNFDQDIELIEDFIERCGLEKAAQVLEPIWNRPILKRDAHGIHGTLFYEYASRRQWLPASKREIDWNEQAINAAQRKLYRSKRETL
jgi:hypothetical protein